MRISLKVARLVAAAALGVVAGIAVMAAAPAAAADNHVDCRMTKCAD